MQGLQEIKISLWLFELLDNLVHPAALKKHTLDLIFLHYFEILIPRALYQVVMKKVAKC